MSDARSYDQLKSEGVNFWPAQLAERERSASIIPRLLNTQEKFISVLHVADSSPNAWRTVLPTTSELPANLFLKHLMILSDIGGEKLQRFKSELRSVFKKNKMHYRWESRNCEYSFKTFQETRPWTNKNLAVDGEGLANAIPMNDAIEDVVTLLMHGGASIEEAVPEIIAERCIIGTFLGRKQALDRFVRQRYIWVSRITGGATANMMGHLAQDYVKEQLKAILPNWDFSNRTISGISHTGGRTDMPFDIVAQSPNGHYCAIEVSFQFTTNSTIERKAGQAQARQRLLHSNGHRIAYVIDGAGNFERRSALSTICQYSDCTVTFRDSEINALANFLKSIDTSS